MDYSSGWSTAASASPTTVRSGPGPAGRDDDDRRRPHRRRQRHAYRARGPDDRGRRGGLHRDVDAGRPGEA